MVDLSEDFANMEVELAVQETYLAYLSKRAGFSTEDFQEKTAVVDKLWKDFERKLIEARVSNIDTMMVLTIYLEAMWREMRISRCGECDMNHKCHNWKITKIGDAIALPESSLEKD
jgi:hypothetical protein